MKRTFLGCFVALCVAFVSGCGGGGGENSVIDAGSAADQAAVDAADEDYEAQMNEDEGNPDDGAPAADATTE